MGRLAAAELPGRQRQGNDVKPKDFHIMTVSKPLFMLMLRNIMKYFEVLIKRKSQNTPDNTFS